jgi:hypothetical protein
MSTLQPKPGKKREHVSLEMSNDTHWALKIGRQSAH